MQSDEGATPTAERTEPTKYCAELLYRLDGEPFEKPANDQVVYLASEVDALRVEGATPTALQALTLAREATNGWACYAKRNEEHAEIRRLHRELDALAATLRGETPPKENA